MRRTFCWSFLLFISSVDTKEIRSWTSAMSLAYALKRYALDFFGTQNISKITAKEVNDFVIWRRLNYVRTIPSDATIKRELSYLRKVFRYAYKKGFISASKMIEKNKAKNAKKFIVVKIFKFF